MPKPRKSRIQPYITPKLQERLALYCARRGVTESAVVEAALTQYLDGLSDVTLLFRRIDAGTRRTDQLSQKVDQLGEFMNQFVKLYLRNTPPLPDAERSTITRQAAARYRQMLERTAQSLSAGKTFVDELPRDSLDPGLSDSGSDVSPSLVATPG